MASPLERAQQTAEPIAAQFGLPVAVDERLIESANCFEGKRVGVGDGVAARPAQLVGAARPVHPVLGRGLPGIAARMFAAVQAARARGRGARGGAGLATSCRSGRCAGTSSASGSGTTRAGGSAGWPASPRFHFDGAKLVGIGYTRAGRPPDRAVARQPGRPRAPDDARRWPPVCSPPSPRSALAGCTSRGRGEAACTAHQRRHHSGVRRTSAPHAPKLAGELLDGGSYDWPTHSGQVVVLNFWGSWCAPCRAEADDLESAYQATKGHGVTFLGHQRPGQRDKAHAPSSRAGHLPEPVRPVQQAGAALRLRRRTPSRRPSCSTGEGRIAAVIRGAVTQDDLQPIVERIAAEKPASS